MKTNGGLYISRIKQVQDRVFFKLLDEVGIDISSGQGRILFVLWQESPLNISEIAKRTSLAKTTMTAMLDRLEHKCLISRMPDKSNRRQIKIALSEEAKKMKDSYQAISDEMTAIFYKGFTENEIVEFEQKLKRIINNLEEKEKEN